MKRLNKLLISASLVGCLASSMKAQIAEKWIELDKEAGILEDKTGTLDSILNKAEKYIEKSTRNGINLGDKQIQKAQAENILENIYYIIKLEGIEESNKKNVPFNEALKTKKFNDQNLASLYVAIAENEDLPIKAAKVGEHFFVRWYFDDNKYIDWETSGGLKVNDEVYEQSGKQIKLLEKDDFILIENKSIEFFLSNPRYEGSKDITFQPSEEPEKIDEVHKNSGDFWMLKGDYKKAIEDYSKAIESNKSFKEVYNSMGKGLYLSSFKFAPENRTNTLNKALESYENAIKLDKENSAYYSNKVSILKELNKKKNLWEDNSYSNYEKDFLKMIELKISGK